MQLSQQWTQTTCHPESGKLIGYRGRFSVLYITVVQVVILRVSPVGLHAQIKTEIGDVCIFANALYDIHNLPIHVIYLPIHVIY